MRRVAPERRLARIEKVETDVRAKLIWAREVWEGGAQRSIVHSPSGPVPSVGIDGRMSARDDFMRNGRRAVVGGRGLLLPQKPDSLPSTVQY